jgi:hypothetical protein
MLASRKGQIDRMVRQVLELNGDLARARSEHYAGLSRERSISP